MDVVDQAGGRGGGGGGGTGEGLGWGRKEDDEDLKRGERMSIPMKLAEEHERVVYATSVTELVIVDRLICYRLIDLETSRRWSASDAFEEVQLAHAHDHNNELLHHLQVTLVVLL
ncbi:hypothetical protein ONZ45_g12603 [Pleurotus djamor]|nr:hypothetical protein ONZ45_g12603 [Pleurotus djamor]